MIITRDKLAEIDGIHVEYSGRLGFDPEEMQSWCENWLYEQRSVEVDDGELTQLMTNCEMTRDQACLQLVCDAAYAAWLTARDSEPTGADAVAVSPIIL